MIILIGICIIFAIWLYSRVTDNKPPPRKNIDIVEAIHDEDATVESIVKAIDNKLVGNTKNLIRDLKELHEEQKNMPDKETPAEIAGSFFVMFFVWIVGMVAVFGGGAYFILWLVGSFA